MTPAMMVAASKAAIARRKQKAKPDANAPLGSGGRFASLKEKLSQRKGVTDPGALAAAIGRKVHGGSQMAKWAAAGRAKS
jgi:hypothetical protein